jgi:hypothetical protein
MDLDPVSKDKIDAREADYSIDMTVAIKDATPATTVVALANFLPVPPPSIVSKPDMTLYGRG